MCPFAIQLPGQLTNCGLLKRRRHKDVIIGRCLVSRVFGAVFCLMCPLLLVPCHSFLLILPLYCSFLTLTSTHKSLLPLQPRQAALCATVSLEAEKGTGRFWPFPFPGFTRLLIFMTYRNLAYFKTPMALSSWKWLHVESYSQTQKPTKDAYVDMYICSHILGNTQMWSHKPQKKRKATGEVFGLLGSKLNLGRLHCPFPSLICEKTISLSVLTQFQHLCMKQKPKMGHN